MRASRGFGPQRLQCPLWAQRGTENVLRKVVWRLVPPVLFGIATGSALALSLPAPVLPVVFGAFLSFLAGRMAAQALKR